MPNYLLKRNQCHRMMRLAKIASAAGHREVCGIFCSDARCELRFLFLKNEARKAGKFLIRAKSIETLERLFEGSEHQLMGAFHSHPISEAIPGPGDLKNAFYRQYAMIYDVIGDEFRLWKLNENGAAEIRKKITSSGDLIYNLDP